MPLKLLMGEDKSMRAHHPGLGLEFGAGKPGFILKSEGQYLRHQDTGKRPNEFLTIREEVLS